MRRIVTFAGAAVVLVVASGCSSKLKDRNALLAAENADLRQQKEDLEGQYAQASAEADRTQAEYARAQESLRNAQALAAQSSNQNSAYQTELSRLTAALSAAEQRASDANAKMIANLRDTKPTGPATTSTPQLEAFRRDLQARLAQYRVTGVDVDVRTAQDGRQRVAVVLQNSFRAGSATLSSNPSAVKAIVGLGKLITQAYPGSRVTVEGHTDSDPIRKSKWESNEALSLARADEVKKLLRQAGVGDGAVSAVGMGARQPVAKGATDRAKAQNRRVEIYITPSSM
jgi:flagellar motor protein MotB